MNGGERGQRIWLCGEHELDFSQRPLVMGILNLTPDSFHAASRVDGADAAARTALAMAAAGADLLDLGAESTRPGADTISPAEEQDRLLPAIKAVQSACDLPLTVDTRNAETARLALDAGCAGINDISAGEHDLRMLPLAADRGCGLILMHMQGEPRSMQDAPDYDDVRREVATYLASRARAAETVGVDPRRIAIDPGIGFGKRLEHNLALLAGLAELADGRPLLLGASRKSFIAHIDGAETESRLGGSLAAAAVAQRSGAAIIRVHDVQPTVQLLDVLAAIETMSQD